MPRPIAYSHVSRRAAALAGIATLTMATAAWAQENPVQELPGIVVEGSSLDLTPVPVERLSSATTVVSRQDIAEKQIKEIDDALRLVPGLAVSRTGGTGGQTEVRLRGSEANHVLVLIDGVEVNTPTDGDFDFSSLLVDDIERIEVVRGPQSGLWGSNALGGLINIVTTRGEGPLRMTASAEGGSFETGGYSIGLSGGSDQVWGAISASGLKTDGYNFSAEGVETDGARIQNFNLRGGIRIAPWLSLEGFVRDLDKRLDYDGNGAGPDGFLVSIDQPGSTESRKVLAGGGTLTIDPFDGVWQTRLFANTSETDRRNNDATFGASTSLGSRDKYGLTSKLTFDQPGLDGIRHTLTGLIEEEHETFEQSSDPATPERSKQSYALDYRGDYLDSLFLSASVRHDDSDTLGAFDTHRLGAAYLVQPTGTRLHASVGTGVVFPTMFEQFGVIPGIFTPNPNLKPETSQGWDAGVEQTFADGAVVVDVTYFDQNLEDEISAPFFGPPENLAGESTRQGIEVTATLRPVSTLDVIASYTHLDAVEPDGENEVRRPEHSGSLSVAWRFLEGRGTLSAGVVYNGDMYDNTFDAVTFEQGRTLLDAYTLVNLAASYDVSEQLQIYGRLENAFDTDDTEVYGYETAGVAAYAGVRLRLEDGTTAGTGQ